MWQLEKPLGQTQLGEDLERRGVNRVAAEITEEVPVLLQDEHIQPCPGEQQAKHGAGRPTAGNATIHSDVILSHSGHARPSSPEPTEPSGRSPCKKTATMVSMWSSSVSSSTRSAGKTSLPASWGSSIPIKARALDRTSWGRSRPSSI